MEMGLINRKMQTKISKFFTGSSSPTLVVPINYENSIDYPNKILKFSSKNSSYSSANFIATYFDFSYILLVSPFRLVSDNRGSNDTCRFSIRKNYIQMGACAFLNILGLYSLYIDMREVLKEVNGEDASPTKYFDLLAFFFNLTFQVSSLKRFWLEQHRFLSIVNLIRWMESQVVLAKGNMKVQHKNFSRLICTIFAVMSLYEVIWKRVFAPSSTWNKTIWNRKLVSYGRYMFFMVNATESRRVIEPENLSVLDYFLAFIAALTIVESFVLGFYPDLILSFAVLTTWTMAYQLAQNLKTDIKLSKYRRNWAMKMSPVKGSLFMKLNVPVREADLNVVKWPDVYREYKAIRELYEMVNRTVGALFTVYLANSLLFHATGMDAVLVTPNLSYQIRLLFFIVNSTCMFVFAADTCNQFDAMKYWLRKDENRYDIPPDQLYVVMGELKAREIGIRGSNIFTITYPLLWNMMTTVVTYFVICLQARQQAHQKEVQADLTDGNCTQI